MKKIFRHTTDSGDIYEYRFINDKLVGCFVNNVLDKTIEKRHGKDLTPGYKNALRLSGFLPVECPHHTDTETARDAFWKHPLTSKCKCRL